MNHIKKLANALLGRKREYAIKGLGSFSFQSLRLVAEPSDAAGGVHYSCHHIRLKQ